MTKPEAIAARALAGPGFYIYKRGIGSRACYDIRRCPPRKTKEQRASMAATPQYRRVNLINAVASREYHDFDLRLAWFERWENWKRKRVHSKKDPCVTDDGRRIDTLWNFMLAALHWLYKTHTPDDLVPNRFDTAPSFSPSDSPHLPITSPPSPD